MNVEVSKDVSIEQNSHNNKMTIISEEKSEKLKKIDTKNNEQKQPQD